MKVPTKEDFRNAVSSKIFLFIIVIAVFNYLSPNSDHRLRLSYYSTKRHEINHKIVNGDFFSTPKIIEDDKKFDPINPKGQYVSSPIKPIEQFSSNNISASTQTLNVGVIYMPLQVSPVIGMMVEEGDQIALGIGHRLFPASPSPSNGFLVTKKNVSGDVKEILLRLAGTQLTDTLLIKSTAKEVAVFILGREKKPKCENGTSPTYSFDYTTGMGKYECK